MSNPEDNMPGEASAAAPAKILIIDDEEGFRELMSFELGARGYKITTAENGEEGVKKAAREGFAAAVLDLTMPKMGGVETLTALKEIDPKIEVIMATGYATIETAIESMKLGAYDFIAKPFRVEDITRLLERALEKRHLSKQVDKLQEINRFKSEFLANMSHELRTPMNAIIGYSSLLLDKVYGDIPEKQEHVLKRVDTNAKNLLQLINNILDISKISAGKMPVYMEEFNLKDLLMEIVEMMESLAEAKKLRLEHRVEEDLWIKSDKTKLKQILMNLVANSIKFTREGKVLISVARAAGDSRVALKVKDTGIGIKSEDLPILFQEFKQLDSSSTREFGGTGLGLAITKKLTELLGGSISVESVFGSGTEFTVLLPSEIKPPPKDTALATIPAGKSSEKVILSIDDDPEVHALLRDSIKGTGYAFVGALSGEEGIAMARQLKPFVITLDIMMPHRDGWSVLQIIKNDPELRHIPVVIVSIVDNKTLGFSLGASDYIIKPFNRQELVEKLEILARKSEENSAARGNKKKVLVVDDDEAIVVFLKSVLEQEGYAVETAFDGKSAIEKIPLSRPDVLFLDLMMPEVSGFDVLAHIEKASEGLKNMRIVILTAKYLTPQETEHLQTRAEMIIQKGSKSLTEILQALKEKLSAVDGAEKTA